MKLLNFLPIKSIALLLILISPMALMACEKKAENPPIKNSDTFPEQKDVTMSAAPADKKEAPIAVADEGKAKAEVIKATSVPEGTVITGTTTEEKMVTTKTDAKAPKTAKGKAAGGEEDDEEDNSGMDSISENDEVVDDSPASPDAPTAKEDKPSGKAHSKTPEHKKNN